MKHPETEQQKDIIGWQPVYSTNNSTTTQPNTPASSLMWGVCLTVAIISLSLSGGLLWKKAEKTQSEVNSEVQKAVNQERGRIQQCLTEMEPEVKEKAREVRY